jgi:hypothetical protein
VSRIARALPSTIAAGLQLGLGLSLGALGIRLMEGQLWLGVAISAVMLVLMRYKRMPVALIAVVVGIVVGQLLGIASPLPRLDLGLHLPHLTVPSWQDIVHGGASQVRTRLGRPLRPFHRRSDEFLEVYKKGGRHADEKLVNQINLNNFDVLPQSG